MRFKIIIGLTIILTACAKDQFRSELYRKDEKRFVSSFINNTEVCRLIRINPDSDSIPGLPYPIPRYSDMFYSESYLDKASNKIRVADQPTCQWMDVQVANIYYSSDSLKCVALVTVNEYEDSIGQVAYSGYALLGFRNNKNENLKVYPMRQTNFTHFPNRKSLTQLLIRHYCNLGAGQRSDYECGINQPKFFETAQQFQYLDSLNLYLGETGKYYGRKLGLRYPLIYYSNEEPTMDKSLCGGE